MFSFIGLQFLNCFKADVLGLPAKLQEIGFSVRVSKHDIGTGLFHVCKTVSGSDMSRAGGGRWGTVFSGLIRTCLGV